MIIYATIILSILVFIHEGGHYLAARAFGVRVTEFMLGLPGPSIGFKWRGTRFGVTAIPLGGYAKVCGMEGGDQSPHLENVLAFAYAKGTVLMEDVARELGISDDDAYGALDQLTEWGSLVGPGKKDEFNTYRAPEVKGVYELGQGRFVEDPHAFFESEYKQQYRSLPFWKRSVILLAGIAMNLLFAILLFIVIYSIIGLDVQNTQTGEISHIRLAVWDAIAGGFSMIGVTLSAVAGLFNPETAATTVENSTSIVGIAVMSKQAVEGGLLNFLFFMSMISISLGIMNLLPFPPLDGGRFVVEVFQKISRKVVQPQVLNYLSLAGLLLIGIFFMFMVGQDIDRALSGFWEQNG